MTAVQKDTVEPIGLADDRYQRCQNRRLEKEEEITVLYFAKSAELAETRREVLTVPRQLTSRQLWLEIVSHHPSLRVIEQNLVLAVGEQYVSLGDEELLLEPGQEVALVPPLSGG
ncbi:molybdopterin synthase sulfur carrier subunit isoform X1 [Petromyzon marinus]|uniref:molybdopterin synthase sulfur carrier subunit isoform X1 n=1 Tax=Petromyzon marinus TaxID=7757 RepID=UPI003F7003CF